MGPTMVPTLSGIMVDVKPKTVVKQHKEPPSVKTHPVRVLIADSGPLQSQLLARALRSRRDFHVSAVAQKTVAIDAFLQSGHADVALISGNTPPDLGLLRWLRISHPAISAVLLAEEDDRELVINALRSGARGIFLLAQDPLRLLCKCITCVSKGEIWAQQRADALRDRRAFGSAHPARAGKEYETALGVGHIPADYDEYLRMLHAVFAQCLAKLEPGGRIAVNVANLGRKPYRSLSRDVIDVLDRLGTCCGARSSGRRATPPAARAPGGPTSDPATRCCATSPSDRGGVQGSVRPGGAAQARAARGLPSEGSMTMDEFVDATTDLWDIPTESATRVGHPAPFPVELPRRLIELYTYRGDLVLDPFMGSGSTAVAALRTERHFVGSTPTPSTSPSPSGGSPRPAPSWPTGPRHGGCVAGIAGCRGRRGHRPGQGPGLAVEALTAAGFGAIEPGVVVRDLGVDVSFRPGTPGAPPGCSTCRAPSRAPGRASPGPRCSGGHSAGPACCTRRAWPIRTDGTSGRWCCSPPSGRVSGRRGDGRSGRSGPRHGPVLDVIELLDPAGIARLGAPGAGSPPPRDPGTGGRPSR